VSDEANRLQLDFLSKWSAVTVAMSASAASTAPSSPEVSPSGFDALRFWTQ
jgi:hypothetical protein